MRKPVLATTRQHKNWLLIMPQTGGTRRHHRLLCPKAFIHFEGSQPNLFDQHHQILTGAPELLGIGNAQFKLLIGVALQHVTT